MRPIRTAAIGLGSIIAVTLVVAAVLPARYRVARSIVIRSDAAALSTRLADFSTREQWVPWKQVEPSATFQVTGAPGAIGSTFAWAGKQIGEGTVTLVQVSPGRAVVTRLEFRKPMPMNATDRFELSATGQGATKVTWTNEGSLSWPVGRLFGLVIDKVVGSDYERGLANLKRVAEASAVASR